jgi:hypothetical protein
MWNMLFPRNELNLQGNFNILNTKKQGKNEIKINYFEKLTKRTFYEFIRV